MRVLIVKLSSLGDLFHALPTVHALKQGLNASVDWVVNREYESLVRCFTDVDEVIAFPRRDFFNCWRPFIQELRRRRYACIVDLQGLLKSAFVTRMARGDVKIGPSFHREGTRWLYPAVAGRRNKGRHAVEENMDVVRHLGLPVPPAEFPVAFPEVSVTGSGPRIGIVPASRWSTKTWPGRCFVDFVKQIRAVRDVSVFLFGGSADVGVCGAIAAELNGHVVDMSGRTTLTEMGGWLREMDLVVANDSGPLHMAAALGTPCLSIYGPTDPVRTGPYGDGHRVIRTSLPCQPCFSRTCQTAGIGCLEGVTPTCVAEAALAMLASGGRRD